jgi:predicted NBD/HSP70 family sugar kinase
MPSLDLLRSLTDEHVLRALMERRRLTRAELAAQTGISKPTVSESVRRLCAAGLVADTGERTSGRGRVGSYYALAREVGCALVLGVAPDGIHAEVVDPHGDVVAAADGPVGRPARPGRVLDVLSVVARRAAEGAARRLRLAVVSAADPVDRATGRLVHLPDAPFLVGELAPAEVLAGLVEGAVLVDNDVNWAARAERAAAGAGLDDFAYLHLGEGLGCAVVNDGVVRRGHTGLVGEIAHVLTTGPGGRAVPFIDVFAGLGVRHPGSTAIDGDALLAAIRDDGQALATVSAAVGGVLAALVALADPELVVIGGTWGGAPVVLDAVAARFADLPRHVPVRSARLTERAALHGARAHALDALRAAIVDAG